ncbi:unnamed protein product [Ceratitis capitata]|uniref:(Mediterranean fruit fly) hypothetical protein n=1 Tax=Ceratitis capitata TaxID=7213 RepID=A0A811U1Z1_CERCA|nr:unnamed protein product [Ceratitis capitata]
MNKLNNKQLEILATTARKTRSQYSMECTKSSRNDLGLHAEWNGGNYLKQSACAASTEAVSGQTVN